MKSVQGSFFTGFVTVVVQGERPEHLFQLCMDSLEIVVWDIEKTTPTTCIGKMRVRDIKKLRTIRRGTSYKITFREKRGYPFLWRRWVKKRHIVVSFLMSILLIGALSNMVWSIQITGVSSDIEEEIVQTLEENEIKKGTWTFSVGSASDIQHVLTEEIPELLWIGVEKKGTTFLLEGIEKKRVDPIEVNEPQNLIARKSGVITYMHVSKGEPVVDVNDTVKKGDPLVLGTTKRADENDEEETSVAAEGEVIAETWYEVEVTSPLESRIEKVTGAYKNRWYLDVISVPLPIWGWKDPSYEHVYVEEEEKPVYFLQWKTPFTIKKKSIHEQTIVHEEYTKEEAIQNGIEQVHNDIKLEFGTDTIIKGEQILHESEENGKVNIQLLITVEEDIVETEPLLQGD